MGSPRYRYFWGAYPTRRDHRTWSAAGSLVRMVAHCRYPAWIGSYYCQYCGLDPQFDGSGAAQYLAWTGGYRLVGAGGPGCGPHSGAPPGALHTHAGAPLAHGWAGSAEIRRICGVDGSGRNASHPLRFAVDSALALTVTLHSRHGG